MLAVTSVGSPVAAQVVLDGTTGPAGALGGPDYAIGAELGRRAGPNLFHSFERFGLRTGESATFSGPDSIAYVISRVTGGERSDIDGTLRSTVPGADLWFLNPAGVVFGPNARLDLQGSFHVSTADELRLANGAVFSARDPGGSTLTVAPPAAFGFLGAKPADIAVEGSLLVVPPGEALSLIGGDLSVSTPATLAPDGRIDLVGAPAPGTVMLRTGTAADGTGGQRGTITLIDARLGASDGAVAIRGGALVFERSSVLAPGGRIDLVGAPAPGGVTPRGGPITLTDAALGASGGAVAIRGGALVLERSFIQAPSTEDGDSGGISIVGEAVRLEERSLVGSAALGPVGDAGPIAVTADRLDLRGASFITSSSGPGSTGAGGDISLKVDALNVAGGSSIITDTFGTGRASRSGDLTVTATEGVTVAGAGVLVNGDVAFSSLSTGVSGERSGDGGRLTVRAPRLEVGDGGIISATTSGSGRGGDIELAAGRLVVSAGGAIRTSSASGTGAAGDLTVAAGEGVTVTGFRPAPGGLSSPSTLETATFNSRGPAGRMTIRAPRVEVSDGAFVQALTGGPGAGGAIDLEVGRLIVTGNAAVTASSQGSGDTGPAGSVTVTAGEAVTIADGGAITAFTSGSGRGGRVAIAAPRVDIAAGGRIATSTLLGTGDGGPIAIAVDRLTVTDGGFIQAATLGRGDAGDLTVTAEESVIVAGADSRLQASTAPALTDPVPVPRSSGAGGTIRIDAPAVVVADGGTITARSRGTGEGGSVVIRARDTFRSTDASVAAASASADAGDVVITAGRLIDLEDSEVTTSAAGGTGGGGNIFIDPEFVVLGNSRVVANAREGAGGDIRIVADNFIATPDSVVDASSDLGIDGTVAIEAPEQDVAGGLVALPASFVDAAALLPASCAVRSAEAAGRFTVAGRGGLPQGPDAPLPGLYAALVAAPAGVAGDEAAHRADEALRRAEADLHLGFHRRAVAMLEPALVATEASGDGFRTAALAGALGAARLAAGVPGEARPALARSLQLAHAGRHAALEATTLTTVGNALAAATEGHSDGEAGPALGAYDGAVELALAADQPGLAARAALNAARLLARRGESAAAAERVRFALEQLERAPDAPERPLELVAAGLALGASGAGAGSEAAALFERAAASAQVHGDARAESYALGHLGALLQRDQGRAEEALRLTRRALFLAQAADAPEALYRWQWQAGRLLAGRGETDAAIAAYEGAVATLQAVRADLPAFDPATGRSLFRQTVGPVFLELADLLLQRAAATGDPAARQPGLLRARGVVEGLKGAELADYFKDECLAQLEARAAPLDRLLAKADAAVLYPIILPDRLELLLSLPDGTLARAAAPVPAGELERVAGRLRLALQGLGDARPHARQLYEWLIRPVEGALAGREVETLVFVPDGPLRSIPLAALHDGERYVVERFAVATAPGLSLLDPRPIARTEIRLLAAGLTESVGGFPPLPQVAEELRAIHTLHGGTLLMNKAFVTAGLREALEAVPYTVVHLASHAQFSSDPAQTFLLTHDGRLGLDELEGMLGASQFREEPVELMVLSACETAAGDDRAALGLAGVAVKAGARSALATLWQVSDEATAVAAAEFYRQLGAEDAPSKAEALRRAQQLLLADARYREPFYWAPFLLIGNWL